MSRFTSINIELKELKTGRVVNRNIDISNIMNWSTRIPYTNPEAQRECLEDWIVERGMEQHNSELELVGWVVV